MQVSVASSGPRWAAWPQLQGESHALNQSGYERNNVTWPEWQDCGVFAGRRTFLMVCAAPANTSMGTLSMETSFQTEVYESAAELSTLYTPAAEPCDEKFPRGYNFDAMGSRLV